MNEKAIGRRLVEHGQALFDEPRPKTIQFTKRREADSLVNDLESCPHAYVLANLMNRQVKAEKAWLIPYLISRKLKGFSMEVLSRLSQTDIQSLMSNPPLHHYVKRMSTCFHSAVQRIRNQYAGDASRIWRDKPSGAEVVYRFLEFDGAGPKIANLAANDLARKFKIPFADYFSIDISADVHVRRVFGRLGLCARDATVQQVIYKARALSPEFPGLMDFPSWEIGSTWCKKNSQECDGCYMQDLCPSANAGASTWRNCR